MGDEAVIDVAVDSGHVVDAEPAIGSPAAGNLAYVGLLLQLTGGAQVVLHVEADVVAAYLLAPLLTECGGAATVGKDYDVALGCHQAVVPPVAPSLAKGSLGTSEEYLDCGIDLSGIEFRRIEDPGKHLLAVHGRYPAFLDVAGIELAKDVSVLVGDPAERSVGFFDSHKFGREFHRTVAGEQCSVDNGERRIEVVPGIIRGDAVYSSDDGINIINSLQAFRKGCEVDGL